MFSIQQFKNCESPSVSNNYELKEILNTIKYGNDRLPLIQSARTYDKSSVEYRKIKDSKLPTFRFNFKFNSYASNKNIISSSGLIYIDVDNINDIPNSDFIYAKWKSLSTKGFGVIVKVDNLNLYNFSNTYNEIGKQLNVIPDPNARKATQQTVLSYDPNLYFNPNSTTYTASTTFDSHEVKKVPSAHILKKERRGMLGDGTFSEYNNTALRFNNISDYFIDNDGDYVVFEDKINICEPYLPLLIQEGKRNGTMFYHLTQHKMLNPHIDYKTLKSLSESINKRMVPRLPNNEVNTIINNVLKGYENDSLKLILNKERKFLFNPKSKLTFKEIMGIVNKENGRLRIDKTKLSIYDVIESWDYKANKKITQGKVANLSGISERTVKRYWSDFKEYVAELNREYKAKDQQ